MLPATICPGAIFVMLPSADGTKRVRHKAKTARLMILLIGFSFLNRFAGLQL
jgi:hypothetical protein